jgi:cyclic beta-1,2-glucan synthetase
VKLAAEVVAIPPIKPRSPARVWDSLSAATVYAIRRTFSQSGTMPTVAREEPIRAELFGIERLEQHAESLAAAQHVGARPSSDNRLQTRPLIVAQARLQAVVAARAGAA